MSLPVFTYRQLSSPSTLTTTIASNVASGASSFTVAAAVSGSATANYASTYGTVLAGSTTMTVSSSSNIAAGQLVTSVVSTTGTASLGSSVIAVGSASNLLTGQIVSGYGIQSTTQVVSISGTNVTVSLPTTSAISSENLTFTNPAIQPNTLVVSVAGDTVTLSQPVISAVGGIYVTFAAYTMTIPASSLSGPQATVFEAGTAVVGMSVNGAGIATGTIAAAFSISGSTITITLSQPVAELLSSSTVTFIGNGLTQGQIVSVPGIPSGTPVASVSGTVVSIAPFTTTTTISSGTSVTFTSAGGDPLRGQGLSNFLSGINAVAQAIQTRLLLLQGEWFLNLQTGTPLFQSILGVPNTNDGVALILRQRILGTPYVTGLSNLVVTYAGANRSYSFSCDVQTVYGTITLNQPLPGIQATV